MRRFILLAFIGIFLTRNVAPSKIYGSSSLAWLFGLNQSNDSKQETRTVCQTEECKKMANVMLENMNKSVEPCDDFYEYACGKWPELNPIPDGSRKWTAFKKLQMDINSQIIDISSSGFNDSDPFAVQLAKRWYKSCMDTDAMDKQGLGPLVSTILRIGGWPMVMHPDEWDEQEYSWQKVDNQYMRLTGRNTFHEVRIKQDVLKKNQKVVHIDTPYLPPGANKLRSEIPLDSDEEEDESDEDSSDEEDDSQEPGSEGEDDSKDDESYYDYMPGGSDKEDDSQGSGSGDDSTDDEDYYDYGSDDSDNDDDDYNGSGDRVKMLPYIDDDMIVLLCNSHSGSGDGDNNDKRPWQWGKGYIDDDIIVLLCKTYSGSGDRDNDDDGETERTWPVPWGSGHNGNDDDNDSGSGDRDNYDDGETERTWPVPWGSGHSGNDDDNDSGSGDRDNYDDGETERTWGVPWSNGPSDNDDDNDSASGDYDNRNDNNDGSGSGNGLDNVNGSAYIDLDNNDGNLKGQVGGFKKKVDKRKISSKIVYRKKLGHRIGEKKSDAQITKKHNSHQMRKQRVKRRVIPIKNENKRRFTHSGKISARKNKRNHVKEVRRERRRKAFETAETMSSAAPWGTEETYEKKGTTTRQEYADYISKVARIIAEERGTKILQEHLDKDIKDMINFQMKLTKIIPPVSDSRWDLQLTLDDFQEWYAKGKSKTANSKINWIYKIEELFDEANVRVNRDLNVEIGSPTYFERLLSLLDKTPSRTIVNYIHWNFISKIIKTTTNEMRQLYYLWENEKSSPRSFICSSSVGIRHILAYEFIGKYFSDDIARTALDMLDDIQKEVEYLIKESDWMDDDAKDFALTKLIYLKKIIGYPEWYKNSTIVRRYLQGFMVGKSHYENVLSYRRYIKWKELRKLTDDTETTRMDPTIVNAFFAPWKNALAITAADFQSPLFAYNRPQSINFGIIGFIMAHEVNHGFDSRGHMFNKNGDYMGRLSAMAKSYGEKEHCFVEQFNNYTLDKTSNKKIEDYGYQTIRDNIADTMGLQAVFKAYQKRERECGKSDPALPGMEEFTGNQLFFLSFANLWCEAIKPDSLMNLAKANIHSVGRLRVIGSVSNSEDFAKAYNCPIGSPMNPETKCNIWK